ncbi:MAG TPA: nuclear transport factor 2 family protein [Solimonas sp.]|nr:nuclear transport factor 2 family protein [Solimonas sp.]
MPLSREQLDARAAALRDAFVEAARRNQWGWIADEFYAEDCQYLCEYGGAMRVFAASRAEIKATHYGREMLVGWEGWSFPIERWATGDNLIITHWWNRGPGLRADGSPYQTPGTSFIEVGADGRFTRQLDLFDLAHQMHLCDELEAAGLLSAQLKAQWVVPMKRKLIAMLGARLPPG